MDTTIKKTQAKVRKKLTEAQAQIDGGAYIAPSKITVAEWLDRWQKDCLRKVKDSTKQRYEMDIRLYIKPEIGRMQLSALKPSMITAFYSKMQQRLKSGGDWCNEQNFVFTNEAGQHLSMYMVYKYFKSIVKEMGLPQVRFHGLRHPDVKQATKK